MAALLVSQNYGVAPDATLYTYQTATDGAASSGSCKQGANKLDRMENLLNQAIDDGAQIISIFFE